MIPKPRKKEERSVDPKKSDEDVNLDSCTSVYVSISISGSAFITSASGSTFIISTAISKFSTTPISLLIESVFISFLISSWNRFHMPCKI